MNGKAAIGILVGSIAITGAGTRFTSQLLAMSGLCIFILNILTRVLATVFLAVFLFKNLAQARKSKDLPAQEHGADHTINK